MKLTDIIINKSIEQNSSFAVMPCCHSDSTHIDDSILQYLEDKTDIIDTARIIHAQNNGYNIILRNINPRITDKNRIIMGKLN
ncbi:hypothetical protein H8D83_01130 [Candidatus Woesearchaeota archaeon]|nr:hypothetical protein [Candidatus Woesearchaeota archaeon]MBL7051032.1 hypothetical protein [Candidatus Woesearchaeota archaeon]